MPGTWLTRNRIKPSSYTEQFHVRFGGSNASDAELFYQHFGYVGRKEGRKRRTQVDMLHTQAQEGQQDDDRLLFVPGNVVHDGEFVDVVQLEDFLQLQGNDGQCSTNSKDFAYGVSLASPPLGVAKLK